MQHFQVSGMSCAACSARVEKAVSALPGVDSCAVSLLTNSMSVTGSASTDKILQAVEKAGYHAAPLPDPTNVDQDMSALPSEQQIFASPNGQASPSDALRLSTAPQEQKMRLRLCVSISLLAILMYISMFGVMWGAPLPAFLRENPTVIALVEMLLAAAVMIVNQHFFINGTKGLLRGAPNMDTLVSLGSAASFGSVPV